MKEKREKMKIGIIGLGIVGTAQAYLSQNLGHEVYGCDIVVKKHRYCEVVKDYIDADIIFICTPEAVVEDVVKKLTEENTGLFVIKSTVPVGTTKTLAEKYDVHISHNPEFLRERYLLEDVMKPSRVVIGQCCREHGMILQRFYEPLEKQIFVTDSTTSETVKLISNSFRALTITFWNEIDLLCNKMNIKVEDVAAMAEPDKVLGEYEGGKWGTKFFGTPYGGKCLPKDMRHLISCFYENNMNPGILVASEKFNKKLGEAVK